jgi:hypothetical protein
MILFRLVSYLCENFNMFFLLSVIKLKFRKMMNKKLCVLTMLCTVIFAPAKAGFWSYRYWYCPVD